MASRRLAERLVTLAIRGLLAAGTWWVLVEGNFSAMAFGAPVIALALATRFGLTGPSLPRVRFRGLLRFGAVFLTGIVRGGFDVARRALSRRLPINPDWYLHRLQLRGGAALRLFMMAMSMMPGAVSVDLEQDELRIHLLTLGDAQREQIEALEQSIAHAFGELGGSADR